MSEILETFNEEVEKQQKSRNLLLRFLTNRIVYALHLFSYLSVNGLLIMLWLVSWTYTGLTFFWPFYPLFGWGFGLGFHILTYTMYNDRSEYLSYIREQSNYIMTFIYHAFFYVSINLFLFLINLIDLTFIWFTWSLGMWGIAFGYHAVGFFTWNKIFDRQWKKLRPKYQEYSKNRLKSKIKYKIGNEWMLLVHLTYFIVTFIIVNVYIFVGTGFGAVGLLLVLDVFGFWGLYLAWQAVSYIIYYNIQTIKSEYKGLIIHFGLIIIFNARFVFEFAEISQSLNPIFIVFFMLISAIGIIIHAIVAYRWDKMIENTQTKVRTRIEGKETTKIEQLWSGFSTKEPPRREISQRVGEMFDEDYVRSTAKGLLFWRWSFIAHFIIYICSLIFIGIILATQGRDLLLLVHPTMGWLIGVAFHGAIYIIVLKRIEGFFTITAILHLSIYVVTCVYLVILNVLFVPGVPWSLYAILGWGIGLGFHLLLAYSTRMRERISEEKVSTKEMAWKWSFIIHLFIYLICLVIIGISLAIQGELYLIIHPTMGWLIGVAFHGAIYIIVKKPIKGFLSGSAFLHLTVYIVVSIYLVILNILFSPEFPWSAIAIAGWGIGIGLHVLLAYLTKK